MHLDMAHSHPTTFGGGERAVLETARALATRHQVRLLMPPPREGATYPDLLTFPRVELQGLDWLIAQPDADAVLANSFGANLLSVRNGPRVAYWVHSLRSVFLQPGARRPDLLLRRAVDRLAVRRCARLIANSAYTASRFPALYGRRADAIVYPGVDLALFRPTDQHARYAITVGRLAPERGLDHLLRLWSDLPDVPLLVVGTGDLAYTASLRAHAPPNVRFLGPLSPDQVAARLQASSVAVFTSPREEFGIAPLEALASGVPVVALDDGGVRETVTHGENGYLVSSDEAFRDAVGIILADPAVRSRLSAAARERAELFSWESTARGIEQVCLALLEARA